MSAIERAMSETVTAIWESQIGTEIRLIDTPTNDDALEPVLVGCVHLTGHDGGVVMLECAETLAREAASVMFQLPQDQVRMADAQDALGELTSILGGNLKGMLSEGHQLSLPTVVEGREFRTRFIGMRLAVRVRFECSGKHLVASSYQFLQGHAPAADTGTVRSVREEM